VWGIELGEQVQPRVSGGGEEGWRSEDGNSFTIEIADHNRHYGLLKMPAHLDPRPWGSSATQ
jgi:hypothetical protein